MRGKREEKEWKDGREGEKETGRQAERRDTLVRKTDKPKRGRLVRKGI